MRPDQIIPALLAADPARPRVTFYDDTPGGTQGERIELSAKVLANWVNKAANLLQDEYDVGPGSRIALRLPAAHWRAVYWAFAVWAAGGTVVIGSGPADVLVTDQDAAPTDGEVILVTLPALARSHPGNAGGALDEARELASHPDQFTAWQRAGDDQVALEVADPAAEQSYAHLVQSRLPAVRAYLAGDPGRIVRQVADVLAGGGSVVLVRNPDQQQLPARLAAEGAIAIG